MHLFETCLAERKGSLVSAPTPEGGCSFADGRTGSRSTICTRSQTQSHAYRQCPSTDGNRLHLRTITACVWRRGDHTVFRPVTPRLVLNTSRNAITVSAKQHRKSFPALNDPADRGLGSWRLCVSEEVVGCLLYRNASMTCRLQQLDDW